MEDRFRFRAWYKPLEIILSDFEFHNTYTTLGTIAKDNNYILMQCTGLKDRNGKLIYEGDIVRAKYYPFYRKEDGKYNYYAEICWDKESASFFYYTFCISKDVQGISTGNTGEISEYKWEVIGNIYENKELLEE